MKSQNILITGGAGFIGFHLAHRLFKTKNKIVLLDNLNNYYSVKLKRDRLKNLKQKKNFKFYKINLENYSKLESIFKKEKFDIVIHLAAQAGVRYSLINPKSYINRNIIGFFNILDISKKYKVKHFIFASTSSIYGDVKKFPITENSEINKPIQLYAATKGSNELISHAYSKIYKMKITGLRFFTVYGPWGRPDMALYIFTKKIIKNQKIKLFNYGRHIRDFTFVDDIISGIQNIIFKKSKNKLLFNIYNIGNGKPVNLINFLTEIEKNLKKKAKLINEPLQKGDIYKTHASINKIKKDYNYKPRIDFREGIKRFVSWFKAYHQINQNQYKKVIKNK